MNLKYERIAPAEIFIDERELWARLGGIGAVDDEKIKEVVAEISSVATPVYVGRELSVMVNNGACISAAGLTVASADFARIASGCRWILLLGVTLGIEVDRLIRKRCALSVSDGFIYDAVASAMAEGLMNLAEVRTTLGKEHTGRFSPGYGDMPLEIQGEIISLLEGRKMLGLALGDGGVMSPAKSITALMGIR